MDGQRETERKMAGRESGFTLIELLVVMLILSTLAMIAVPSFMGQTEKADDARIRSAVRPAALALETWALGNDGNYADARVEDLERLEPSLRDLRVSLHGMRSDRFRIRVRSADGRRRFDLVRRPNGQMRRICRPKGSGACPASGRWD